MLARVLGPDDLNALNEFCKGDKGDIDPARDILVGVFERVVIDAKPSERLVGVCAARKMFLCHELRIDESTPLKRRVVESIYNYLMGMGRILCGDQPGAEAMFYVPEDRDAMVEFHKEHGAVQSPFKGTVLYRRIV